MTAFGVGAFDILTEGDSVEAEEIESRNAHLDGTTHPITGVEFESKTIILDDGSVDTGVFPIFESKFDAILPEETYRMSDTVHIGIANMQLI